MVTWNDKVEGIRLDEGHPAHGYALSCLACGRTSLMRHAVALSIWGGRRTARQVARSLVCSRCGLKRGQIQIVVDTRQPQNARPDNYWNGMQLPEVVARGVIHPPGTSVYET